MSMDMMDLQLPFKSARVSVKFLAEFTGLASLRPDSIAFVAILVCVVRQPRHTYVCPPVGLCSMLASIHTSNKIVLSRGIRRKSTGAPYLRRKLLRELTLYFDLRRSADGTNWDLMMLNLRHEFELSLIREWCYGKSTFNSCFGSQR